ncbi:MAG: NB-ARC domain-containing protein [Cyanobacteria bacterium P01_H01_bin.119]
MASFGQERKLDGIIRLTEHLLATSAGGPLDKPPNKPPNKPLNKPLSDLQQAIVTQVWQGRRYGEIAMAYGCTEGHVKDVAANLWLQLSQALGKKVGKYSFRSALMAYQRAIAAEPADFTDLSFQCEVSYTPSASISPHRKKPGLIGRDAAIAQIRALIHQGHRLIVLQGEGGIGKTTLAQHYLQDIHPSLELMMAKEPGDIITAERVVEEWLRQDLAAEPGGEFGISLLRLRRQLQIQPIGILIDNLEPALDAQGQLIRPHRRYVELLRILADPRCRGVAFVTSRDSRCEPSVAAGHIRLSGLSLGAWRQYFEAQSIELHGPTLTALHRVYSGNAKAMEIVCAAIQTEFEGDMTAYGREADSPTGITALENLVANQVNRLAVLDPAAYRLLCRLGCYRYQTMPTLDKAAVTALLWDVPPERHGQLLTSLKNRSLLAAQKGAYWLHPVIRAEAIARLRQTSDWETANDQAAKMWSDRTPRITGRRDALQALEAYYHYRAIADYTAAADILLRSRDNQWGQFLPLASSLYRMGLVQVVQAAVTNILPRLKNPQQTCELSNILGDLAWIRGDIRGAIAQQQRTIEMAQACLHQLEGDPAAAHRRYYFRMLEVDALLSLGLYCLDLWELEAAAVQFTQVIALSQQTRHHAWAEKATVGLALVKALLGETAIAQSLADKAQQTFLQTTAPEQSGRFAYFIQRLGQTYAVLGNLATAQNLYQSAIAFAEAGEYPQVKANALKGLAEIECQQQHGDWGVAKCQEAIALLEAIGANCDLADAHFQLAQIYRHLGQALAADQHQQSAIALFQTIQAPAQLHRTGLCIG